MHCTHGLGFNSVKSFERFSSIGDVASNRSMEPFDEGQIQSTRSLWAVMGSAMPYTFVHLTLIKGNQLCYSYLVIVVPSDLSAFQPLPSSGRQNSVGVQPLADQLVARQPSWLAPVAPRTVVDLECQTWSLKSTSAVEIRDSNIFEQ